MPGDADHSDAIRSFMEVSGSSDENLARQLLSSHDYSVEAALAAYFSSQGDSSGRSAEVHASTWITEQFPVLAPMRWFAGEFSQAAAAARNENRFALIYLHSPDHDDSAEYCSQVLGAEQVRMILSENFILWCGNVKDKPAFRIMLDLKVTSFPFAAVVMPAAAGGSFAVVRRFDGFLSPTELSNALADTVERFGVQLVAQRMQQVERERERALREEQERAYEEGLERDRRRREERERNERLRAEEEQRQAREIEEEATRQQQEEERAERRLAELESLRRKLALSLPAEPMAGETSTITIRVRLPSGTMLVRRFDTSDAVSALYDFIESFDGEGCLPLEWLDHDRDGKSYMFSCQSNFPKCTLGPESQFTEHDLGRQATLFVTQH